MSSVPYQHLRNNDGWVSPHGWSAEHDVIHELVPFEHFNADPWAQLAELQDYLKGLPEHKSTWRWHGAPDMDNLAHYDQRERLFRDILGAWPYRVSDGRSVFVNPYYGKLDRVEWEPDELQADHYRRMARLGKWSTRDMARRYGVSRKNPVVYLQRRGDSWGELKERGWARVANTVVLTREWTGKPVTESARRLDISKHTLRNWISDHATLETVPQRPSEQGFGSCW